MEATTGPLAKLRSSDGLSTNAGLTAAGAVVGVSESQAASCNADMATRHDKSRLADVSRPARNRIGISLPRCNGGSTGVACALRAPGCSLVALRRRLSPALPLSRHHSGCCDPAVSWLERVLYGTPGVPTIIRLIKLLQSLPDRS